MYSAFFAALLLAVPGRAADREALSGAESRALLAHWAEDLAALDSGKDLAAFLKAHPQDVRTDQRIASVGLFEGGKLFINAGYLTFRLEQLEAKGLRGEAAVKALSWASLHVFAHELQHAATHDRMKRELGFDLALPDRDDELASISRETRVLQEIAAKTPELLYRGAFTIDDDRETDTFVKARGLRGAEVITNALFSSWPQIRTEDPKRLREKSLAQIQDADASLAELDKDLPANPPPEAREYDRMKRKEPQQEKALAKEILSLLDAPERYRAYRQFYARLYEGLAGR